MQSALTIINQTPPDHCDKSPLVAFGSGSAKITMNMDNIAVTISRAHHRKIIVIPHFVHMSSMIFAKTGIETNLFSLSFHICCMIEISEWFKLERAEWMSTFRPKGKVEREKGTKKEN